MRRSLSSLLPLVLSSAVVAVVVVYVLKQVKTTKQPPKSLKKDDDHDHDGTDEAIGGHQTDLHGRPWQTMKKSEKAQWWAANGQIDKDTLRIQENTKDIIFPEVSVSADNIQDWLTVF